MAARYVRPGVAKVMLDLGANREVADERGRTALDLTQEILKAKPKGNPFQSGARFGLREWLWFWKGLCSTRHGLELCAKLLAEADANLDHRDRSGVLATLHMAARYVRPGVAKVMLDLGANREVADERGRTALDLTQEILKAKPKGNPFQSGARFGLREWLWFWKGLCSSTRRWRTFLNGERRKRIWSHEGGGDS
ncbi:probable signal recognition particle 43 kDa protein, chloroplastic [Vigna umbellata]|uniref:probable signal recognition particle 43 kDa protein, chloroplastic n=1 Tax=Vigna umbellata TaxID=87088 RepID=UPI001F5ECB77|nr:probable signal recognition particle 43 kDa protein, chloroplastic [Vigna umbellata]